MRLALSILLVLGLTVQSATYYLSPTGSDSADGSFATPWNGLARADNTLTAGDTLYVRGGVYDFLISSNQNFVCPASSITISNYPGETPVFINQLSWPSQASQIEVNGKTNVRIYGLTLTNYEHGVRFIKATNCEWAYNHTGPSCRSTNTPNAVPIVNFSMANFCQSNWVHGNTFHSSHRDWSAAGTNQADAGGIFALGQAPDSFADKTIGNLVESNTFFHGGHDVMIVQTGMNRFRGNYHHNEDWIYWPSYNSFGGHRCVNFEGPLNVIENSRMAYSGEPFANDGYELLTFENASNIVRGCEMTWGGNGMLCYTKSAYPANNNRAYNNTFGWLGIGWPEWNTNVWTGSRSERDKYGIRTVNATNNIWKNNILVYSLHWTGGAYSSNRVAVSTSVGSNQWFGLNWTNNNGVANDPMFRVVPSTKTTLPSGRVVGGDPFNPDDTDLRLRAGSPCIDTGVWLTTCVGDGSGTSLPVVDCLYFSEGLLACVYPAVAGDRIQLQGQTNTAVITAIARDTATLTLDSSLTWTNGQGVAMAFTGAAPDFGAHEYSEPSVSAGGVSAQTLQIAR